MGELLEQEFINKLIRKELGFVRIEIKEIILNKDYKCTAVRFTAALENKKGEDIFKFPNEREAHAGDVIRIEIP